MDRGADLQDLGENRPDPNAQVNYQNPVDRLELVFHGHNLRRRTHQLIDNEIKTLKGCIPICASCKKIRDDKGYWNQIESYIREHSEADFSHGLCPECAEKYRDEARKLLK